MADSPTRVSRWQMFSREHMQMHTRCLGQKEGKSTQDHTGQMTKAHKMWMADGTAQVNRWHVDSREHMHMHTMCLGQKEGKSTQDHTGQVAKANNMWMADGTTHAQPHLQSEAKTWLRKYKEGMGEEATL